LNHSAVVDAMQLIQIFKLMAALLEPPRSDNYLLFFFQGLDELFKRDLHRQDSTLGKFFTSLNSPRSAIETYSETLGFAKGLPERSQLHPQLQRDVAL
jgi:hypothetical protein